MIERFENTCNSKTLVNNGLYKIKTTIYGPRNGDQSANWELSISRTRNRISNWFFVK